MFITKMSLPRRTFLRGVGAALGLPLLDAMVPALSAIANTPANPARRVGFIYMPNGVAMNVSGIDYWTPRGLGKNFELSTILTPLAPFRDRLLVLGGLDHQNAEAGNDGASGDHTRGTSSWLTGVYPKRTEGADVRNGVSADQIAAAKLGKETVLPSLERPKGVPERFDEHVKLMYELQWLAFRADITRVVTFMLGRDLNFRTYPEVGVTEGHHGLSHHADRPEQILKYSKVGTLQAQLFAGFLQKLRDTPEGTGTLLEHSVFMYGAGLSN